MLHSAVPMTTSYHHPHNSSQVGAGTKPPYKAACDLHKTWVIPVLIPVHSARTHSMEKSCCRSLGDVSRSNTLDLPRLPFPAVCLTVCLSLSLSPVVLTFDHLSFVLH